MKKVGWMALPASLFVLAACGGDSDQTSGGEGDQTVLEMYSWRTEDRSAYEKLIEEFENQHPDITINFQPYDSTEYNTILTNSLVSGQGPDIAQLRPYSGVQTIADNGYLVSLDDVPGVSDLEDAYLDAARGSDGSIYGVPLTLNSGVIFYNESIFEEQGLAIPETYDELLEVSQQLQANDIIPIAQGGRDAYLLSMVHGVIAPSAYGGNTLVEELLDGTIDLTDERLLASLERLEELSEYFPQDFIALDDNDAQAMFYAEEAAMYINGDYRLETFASNIPDVPVGVIPSLGIDEDLAERPVMTWVDGSYGVVESSDKQEEALLFMEFMATQEFGQLFTDTFNRLSPIEA
ncbi:ABC transporter substrate-binding protein [Geomicrobium sp. JCM 19039]|uniref:ABC transporter substrate-binding protein n=1 Tax=Geomicrobium sp. JCM 19039 TaxID=1460636 RepID=UPI00045F20DC|nr:ABC transporter substrate-binding protein [Geomicrobium sp. JCM 19039]GAK14627.1 N-acetyl-D-glucosamine ABC transport system, sugar-binding protein [Geomicrobium sp. JCM 19039]